MSHNVSAFHFYFIWRLRKSCGNSIAIILRQHDLDFKIEESGFEIIFHDYIKTFLNERRKNITFVERFLDFT